MLAIRSTPRVAAIVAAVAGACLLLGGCGGGSSGGTAAAGSSASASAPAASSAPASSSAPALAGLPTPKLTGHFCTDLDNMGKNLPKVPAGDKNDLAALEANGGQLFKKASAYFTALANEAPPQAATELKLIASAYTSMASGGINASSLAQLEKQMGSVTTHGKSGQAFLGLVTYIETHCH
jgi:hypothetical protein